MTAEAKFEAWCIVELMGHRRLAGFVREVTLAGGAFIRLDVPSDPPVTQFYSPSSVYCITPTTEEIARKVAEGARPEPVHPWELPKALPRAASDDGSDTDTPDEDVEAEYR